jgi:hypothetical protein
VRYLKRTPKEGLVLWPDSSKGIQCFVDADFANGWSSEDCDEPSSVYSRTGFVIMYAGCPLVWVSKLQTEVALSTTEAEYIVLSQAMRELIPLLGLLEELTSALQLNKDQPTVYWKACGYDNNNGVLSADLFEIILRIYSLKLWIKFLSLIYENSSVAGERLPHTRECWKYYCDLSCHTALYNFTL